MFFYFGYIHQNNSYEKNRSFIRRIFGKSQKFYEQTDSLDLCSFYFLEHYRICFAHSVTAVLYAVFWMYQFGKSYCSYFSLGLLFQSVLAHCHGYDHHNAADGAFCFCHQPSFSTEGMVVFCCSLCFSLDRTILRT